MVKQIQVEDSTWQELTRLKADQMASDLDEVIKGLLKISSEAKKADKLRKK